jgi:hypothetical protein
MGRNHVRRMRVDGWMVAVREFVGADVVIHDQTSIRLFDLQVKACVAFAAS